MEENLINMREDHSFHVRYRRMVGEARALYNLGNVYHAKGKSFGCPGPQDGGEFPEEMRNALQAAVDFYEENLSLVTALGDRAAQGRAFGNLGNTHYLLGNFRDAVIAHEQRLLIAKEFGDKAAERRAYSNLGNAYIFLGEFETASEYYKMEASCLELALEGERLCKSGDCRAGVSFFEAAVQVGTEDLKTLSAIYSQLGNAYFYLHDYAKALEYHHHDLTLARTIGDQLGEAKASGNLGNTLKVLGNFDEAIVCCQRHLDISRELNDKKISADTIGDEGFFDLLSRFQSNRMDDQRCYLQEKNCHIASTATSSTPPKMMLKTPSVSVVSPNTDEFLDLLASSQSRRLDDQRASFNNLPGLRLTQNNNQSVLSHLMTNDNKEPDEDFFDILIKCQGSRLDDQRCAPPPATTKGPTVPDEDFFSLILRSQAKRMDEQRVLLQRDQNRDTEFGLKDLLQSNALLEFKNSGKNQQTTS
ncbi:PREDICTED: G-protein-signaling modulator 2 [Propithecus coquereli]|uniref:G-protein-signaling modulator 2 n=1 Tax=Propithecus coquereli TaxID=379532 RepID=UPI00063FA34F|nr:PREDICTED: G-protein-signaling modulator 2 [Propithecus coquereli]